jgi:glutathione S-transferase
VDNVYSHRSTQRYKRKPFVSHYWDCRLKGRPPGTPKSNDPNKKKRKRTARERDLCDVKIKITEYFPGAMLRPDFAPDGGQPDPQANNFFVPGQAGGQAIEQQQQFNMMPVSAGIPPSHPGATGQRYYTIQRVNGNGGNGKGDGVAGPHKHGLLESDRVKKNSVQRFLTKKDKDGKKTQVGSFLQFPVVAANLMYHSIGSRVGQGNESKCRPFVLHVSPNFAYKYVSVYLSY